MFDCHGRLPHHLLVAAEDLGRNIPRLRSVETVLAEPDVPYLLRGILPRRGVAAIYGQPASGKTFLAMDLIFGLASGLRSWFGLRMNPAPVIYVPLEGHGGIKRRIQAWQNDKSRELGESIMVWEGGFRLDEQRGIDELSEDANALYGRGSVIVIDTLAQAMAGFDENNSAEMGAAIAGAQSLAVQVDGLVILVHHSGKDAKRGMRGHSSLLAALDASIEVVATSNGRHWKVEKAKDGEAGQEYDFDLAHVDLGLDAEGDPIGSCVVRQAIHPRKAGQNPVNGKHRIAVLDKLRATIATTPLDIEAATVLVAPDLMVEKRRQRTVAKETIDGLVASGHLIRNGDTISLPPH